MLIEAGRKDNSVRSLCLRSCYAIIATLGGSLLSHLGGVVGPCAWAVNVLDMQRIFMKGLTAISREGCESLMVHSIVGDSDLWSVVSQRIECYGFIAT
jgi:hypothetical protein